MRLLQRVLVSGILLSTLLAFVPQVSAVTTTEDFEDYDLTLVYPPQPSSEYPSGWTYSTGGSGANQIAVKNDRALDVKALFQANRQVTNEKYAVIDLPEFPCAGEASWVINFNIDTLPIGGAALKFSLGGTTVGDEWYTLIGATGIVDTAYSTGGGLTTFDGPVVDDFVVAVDTWYRLEMSGFHCANESMTVSIMPTGGANSTERAVLVDGSVSGAPTAPTNFCVACGGVQLGVSEAPALWVDDLQLDDGGAGPGVRFCSNLADMEAGGPTGKWGYEYVSDDGDHEVQELGPGGSISMDDGFLFTGDQTGDTWDFMAKHFDPGSKAFHTNLQIEASVDSTNSVFRVTYSLENSADPDDTQRGNGLDTFLFDETLEFQFKEVENDWQIRGYLAHPLVNGGTRMAFGPAVNFGNPNDPTTFTFWADTRVTGELFQDNMGFSGGGTFYQGPHMALTVPDSNQPTGNRVIAYRALRDINIGGSTTLADHFSDDVVWTQWFVGYGDGRLGNGGPETGIDAETGLNDNKAEGTEDSQDSTCIVDDTGTAMVGDGGAGTTPGSEVEQPPEDDATPECSSPFCVNEDTVPEGFTVAAFNLFLGILMAAAIAAGFYSLGKSKIAMVVGSAIGLILAFTFGLMPIWPILVIVVVATAFIFLSTRGVGS